MEACVRHLRLEASTTGIASLVLIQDTLDTLGHQAVCCEVLSQLRLSAARIQTKSAHILVLAFDQPTARYLNLGFDKTDVLDFFSDPFGWNGLSTERQQSQAWRTGNELQIVWHAITDYLQLHAAAAKDGSQSWILVIDSIDYVLQHTKLQEVLRFLEDVRRHALISSVCIKLHQDLHEPRVVSALTSLCTASLQLKPIQGLQREMAALSRGKQGPPHGQLQLHLKRHIGRVQVESELYTLQQGGGLQTFAVPQEAITAQLLAAQAVSNAASDQKKATSMQERQAQAEEEARLALLTSQAGMKLTLTQQEQAARQAVVLPYEHQGVGQAYQTEDFKDYLPKAAGGQGKGAGQGSLGHILYVRDSASEHDSDEDPDDDLDI